MSGKSSELMMDLLKEMVLLKQLDNDYEKAQKSGSENHEFAARKIRRREIGEQMKALAEPAG
jgi:hypothetical protein